MLDALAYVKAARASAVPAALEISQSGRGAYVWIFFAGVVPATTARAVGTALLHEAMVLRGSMDLRSYGRLFPNQDGRPARTSPRSTTTTTRPPPILAASLQRRMPGYRALGFFKA